MFEGSNQAPQMENSSLSTQNNKPLTTYFDTKRIQLVHSTHRQAYQYDKNFQWQSGTNTHKHQTHKKKKKKSKKLNSQGQYNRARLLSNIVDKIKQVKDVNNYTNHHEKQVFVDKFQKLQNIIRQTVQNHTHQNSPRQTSPDLNANYPIKQSIKYIDSLDSRPHKDNIFPVSQNNSGLSNINYTPQPKYPRFQSHQFTNNISYDQRQNPFSQQMAYHEHNFKKKPKQNLDRSKSQTRVRFTYASPDSRYYGTNSPPHLRLSSEETYNDGGWSRQTSTGKICITCGRDCLCRARIKPCLKCGRKCDCYRFADYN